MMKKSALVLSHYKDFQCIGSDCEDSCCIGWGIHIDKKTYQLYKKNTHPELHDLFKTAVQRNPSSEKIQNYGVISTSTDGRCAFLDEVNLCKIHKNLGPDALSPVCANFPRTANRLGSEIEYSLGLACPEAARLILLNPEPIHFMESEHDPSLDRAGALLTRIPPHGELDPEIIATMNDLRAVVLAILQNREISIEARLLFLGQFMEEGQRAIGQNPGAFLNELPAVIGKFAEMLSYSRIMQDELEAAKQNPALKLNIFKAVISDIAPDIRNEQLRKCFMEANAGLGLDATQALKDDELANLHKNIYQEIYAPFFQSNSHILENCLVHYVFRSLFPLRGANMNDPFRELVCLYLISHVFLLGMAGYHRKLTPEMAVSFFYSFTRLSSHSANYLAEVAKSLEQRLALDIRHLIGQLIVPTAS
jgi:lysine-N-methylase